MRVVVDTNVFISGIFFGGAPGEIIELWKTRRIVPVLSENIISEYLRVARKIHEKHARIEIEPLVELLVVNAEIIDTSGVVVDACEDPDDDKFLECAIVGKCPVIISGDAHLLKLVEYRDIRILNPRAFLEKYGPVLGPLGGK